MKRILCLLSALLLLVSLPALAETRLYDPVAIVAYDRLSMEDWTPSYQLNVPGMLLELSHAEGRISVSVLKSPEGGPGAHLKTLLDQAGETLSVSDAAITDWPDSFDGDGQVLSYAYAYPGGDETHLLRTYAVSWEDMLLEISIDTWGADASFLMDSAVSALIEGNLLLSYCQNASETIGTLTDIIEGDNASALIQLTVPSETLAGDSSCYPLSPSAVVLFPHPDDPASVYPVSPDAASLTDAILTYEDSSDSPAVFRAIIYDGQMEYNLTF